MKGTQTSTRNTGAAEGTADGFTDEERDAIKERAQELRAAGRRGARAAKPDPEANAILGFSDPARLDEGTMWPTAYALTKLTPADETLIAELVRKAAG
ncbi:hypothetical protein ABT224_09630 [Streptomyces sp. NPDC001584]|uniref:hypothetical protein n=1 Tax=Streptomyces sp. NPDC001584 TaxID=3154521 RepID=UPI00332FFB3C